MKFQKGHNFKETTFSTLRQRINPILQETMSIILRQQSNILQGMTSIILRQENIINFKRTHRRSSQAIDSHSMTIKSNQLKIFPILIIYV